MIDFRRLKLSKKIISDIFRLSPLMWDNIRLLNLLFANFKLSESGFKMRLLSCMRVSVVIKLSKYFGLLRSHRVFKKILFLLWRIVCILGTAVPGLSNIITFSQDIRSLSLLNMRDKSMSERVLMIVFNFHGYLIIIRNSNVKPFLYDHFHQTH